MKITRADIYPIREKKSVERQVVRDTKEGDDFGDGSYRLYLEERPVKLPDRVEYVGLSALHIKGLAAYSSVFRKYGSVWEGGQVRRVGFVHQLLDDLFRSPSVLSVDSVGIFREHAATDWKVIETPAGVVLESLLDFKSSSFGTFGLLFQAHQFPNLQKFEFAFDKRHSMMEELFSLPKLETLWLRKLSYPRFWTLLSQRGPTNLELIVSTGKIHESPVNERLRSLKLWHARVPDLTFLRKFPKLESFELNSMGKHDDPTEILKHPSIKKFTAAAVYGAKCEQITALFAKERPDIEVNL